MHFLNVLHLQIKQQVENTGCDFTIQSSPEAVFICDRIFRLFVTVVPFDGIFMRFPGPSSRFTFSNCHGSTAMQIRSTGGIYGIRRLQVKRCGRLSPGPVLALDCCCAPGTWSDFRQIVLGASPKTRGCCLSSSASVLMTAVALFVLSSGAGRMLLSGIKS